MARTKWPSSVEDLTKYVYKRYKKSLHFQHFRFISPFDENLPVLKKNPTGTYHPNKRPCWDNKKTVLIIYLYEKSRSADLMNWLAIWQLLKKLVPGHGFLSYLHWYISAWFLCHFLSPWVVNVIKNNAVFTFVSEEFVTKDGTAPILKQSTVITTHQGFVLKVGFG